MKISPSHALERKSTSGQRGALVSKLLHGGKRASLLLTVTALTVTSISYSGSLVSTWLSPPDVKVVRAELGLPVPGEPARVDVKIERVMSREAVYAASELIAVFDGPVTPEEGSTPTLSHLAESSAVADETLGELSSKASTIVIKDIPIRDAKNLQRGTLSKEGLMLLHPDAEIEEVPIEKTVEKQALGLQHEEVSWSGNDGGGVVVALPTSTPVENEGSADEDSEATVVVIIEDEVDEIDEEMVSKITSASISLKEAKDNLSPADKVLLGVNQDLTALTDEELELVNSEKPSDEVTAEFLRRATSGGSGLMEYPNGEVDESVLTPLSWNPKFLMQKDAARMFELLNRDFKAESGYDLRLTSTYRPLAVQYQVRAESPTMTAVPGTSNHGYGLAVDIAAAGSPFIDYDSYEHQWMMENGHRYGWLHPHWARPGSSMPEPWHFEFGTFYPDQEDGVEFNNEFTPEHRAKWLSLSTGMVG